ncbi:MAG TPA: hypothetical protein VNT55_11875, partial [Baekduia sp.]|nr:hypothetical protein [Baekduia sp.]
FKDKTYAIKGSMNSAQDALGQLILPQGSHPAISLELVGAVPTLPTLATGAPMRKVGRPASDARSPDLTSFGATILVECKNTTKLVGSDSIGWFVTKPRRAGQRSGLLVTANGITGQHSSRQCRSAPDRRSTC